MENLQGQKLLLDGLAIIRNYLELKEKEHEDNESINIFMNDIE